MNKETELARTATTGAFHLLIGKILSRIVSGVGGLILIRLFIASEYGVFNVALIVPSIISLFSDFGTNTAMVKYLAEYRSEGKIGNLKPLVYSNVIFRATLGCGFTLLCYVMAEFFAALVIGKPDIAPFMRVSAFFILAQILYYSAESTFVGLNSMKGAAILMILSEFLSSLLKILLVILGMGVLGALIGWAIGVTTAGLIGIIASILILPKSEDDQTANSKPMLNYRSALKEMLIFGLPLAIAFLALSGVDRFYNFMIAVYCNTGDIGNFSAANKLSSSLLFLTFPVSTVLFPTFSMIKGDKDSAFLGKVYAHSVKYSSLIIIPVSILIIVLAQPLTIFLFGIEYKLSWIYLALLGIGWLFYGLGWDHMKRLLMGQGEVKLVASLGVIESVIAISLGIVLIPMYGIVGAILTSLVAWIPSYIIAAKKSFTKYGIKLPILEVWRIYVSAIITGSLVGVVSLVFTNEVFSLFAGLFIGIIAYVVLVPASKAIKANDIKTLRKIVASQPLVGVILDKILGIMEWVSQLRI